MGTLSRILFTVFNALTLLFRIESMGILEESELKEIVGMANELSLCEVTISLK